MASTTWQNAYVHFFVDDTKTLQVADTDYLCYGAGRTANHLGYVQVELCQTTDVGHPNETVLAGANWFAIVAAVAKKLGY